MTDRRFERIPQPILENWLKHPSSDLSRNDILDIVTELQTREREKNLGELDTQEANAVDADIEWIE